MVCCRPVGTVIDEHVDVVDVTATVIDLAVRNYLWIDEVAAGEGVVDWRIVRRNPATTRSRPTSARSTQRF